MLAPSPIKEPAYGEVMDQLCATVFSSLPRIDQRVKGTAYIRGLLEVRGRKSIRKVAAHLGEHVTEQNLHHFVCDSTWDWRPVRLALARHFADTMPPAAWVVRDLVIPKAGRKSIGVGRVYCPELGQTVNAQQAVGVWSAMWTLGVPLAWYLHVPRAWLENSSWRERAGVPDDLRPRSIGDGAVDVYTRFAAQPGVPALPAVFDVAEMDPTAAAARLGAAGLPFVMKVRDTLRLAVADSTLAGHQRAVLPAGEIASAARGNRRKISVLHGDTMLRSKQALVTGTRVTLPGLDRHEFPRGRTHLRLVAVHDVDGMGATQLWVTDIAELDPGAITRMADLVTRIDSEQRSTADRVGMRDFAGRSYTGWHRHMTLASMASAISTMSSAEPLAAAS